MQRRDFFKSLRGIKKEVDSVIRPPYYNDRDDFYKECIKCDGKCATFCEEQIIIIGEDKTPFLDFKKGGCTYCDECANVCDNDVLKVEYKSKIDCKIEIDMLKCMSWNQTMCFSCKDPCLENAINFLAMFRPEIDSNLCTSCGFCLKYCPTEAIIIK